MRKHFRLLLVVGTHLVAVALGFIGSKLIGNIPYFKVNQQIDLLGLMRLILLVVVSILLFRRFERMKYSDQLKKNTVIKRLEDSIDNLDALDNLVGLTDISYVDSVKLIKKTRREFDAYVQFAGALRLSVTGEELSRFHLACAELKDLLTNSPSKDEPNPEIQIINGHIQVSADRLVEVEGKLHQAKSILHVIQQRVILDLSS